MSQNLSQHKINHVGLKLKTGSIIIISILISCLAVSMIFEYVNPPMPQQLNRNVKAIENIKPEILVNPLIIKKNINISLTIDNNEKLLSWEDFRIQRRLNPPQPSGFRSVLQRKVRFSEGDGFLQIIEFSDDLDALHFLWHLPIGTRHDKGFQYDNSLWTISGRFLQVSPNRAFSSTIDQIKLHSSITHNLGMSLIDLSILKNSKALSFMNLEWDQQYFEKVLKVELVNHVLYILNSKELDNLDSISHKVRDYALGDIKLTRVISTTTSRVLIAKSYGSHVLISTEFPRNLSLKQKYKLQRLFR